MIHELADLISLSVILIASSLGAWGMNRSSLMFVIYSVRFLI